MNSSIKTYQVIITVTLIAFSSLIGIPIKSYINELKNQETKIIVQYYDNKPKQWTPAMSKIYARGYIELHYPKWNNSEWRSLLRLWGKESAWNHLANNPWSSAYGIAQVLKTKPGTPAPLQIEKGLSYIAHRYDRPSKAWLHWSRHGWY